MFDKQEVYDRNFIYDHLLSKHPLIINAGLRWIKRCLCNHLDLVKLELKMDLLELKSIKAETDSIELQISEAKAEKSRIESFEYKKTFETVESLLEVFETVSSKPRFKHIKDLCIKTQDDLFLATRLSEDSQLEYDIFIQEFLTLVSNSNIYLPRKIRNELPRSNTKLPRS